MPTITNAGVWICISAFPPRIISVQSLHSHVHLLYELEPHGEDEKKEEERAAEAAAAAAEGHAHPANQDVEPKAVATSSEPLASVRSLFDYGRWNWVSVLRQILTELISNDAPLSHCATNGQRQCWRRACSAGWAQN